MSFVCSITFSLPRQLWRKEISQFGKFPIGWGIRFHVHSPSLSITSLHTQNSLVEEAGRGQSCYHTERSNDLAQGQRHKHDRARIGKQVFGIYDQTSLDPPILLCQVSCKIVAPDIQIWNQVKCTVGVSSHILAQTASSSLLFLGCVLQCNSCLHCLGPSTQALVPFLVTSFCSFFLRVIFSSSPFFSFSIPFSSLEICP